MAVNVMAMRKKKMGDISGISYRPEARAEDKSPPPKGSSKGKKFKLSLMFFNLIWKKW